MFVKPVRALKRFPSGTGPWLDNMYTRQQMRRAQDDEYKEKKREYYKDNKERFNQQRRDKRQDALKDMKAQGFPIVEDASGVLHLSVKCGRKKIPEIASAVPLAMIQPVGLEELIVLNDPDFLRNIADVVAVPEKGEGIFDLQGYFGLKEIVILKNALKWGMFFHGSWDELAKSTRNQYPANARLALTNDLVDYIGENKALADKYLYFDLEADEWVRKLENNEADQVEDAQDDGVVEDAPGADIAELDKDVIKVPLGRVRGVKPVSQRKTRPLTRNPLRVVQFMVEANIDPWKLVLGTCETTQANSKASGLASCCYAYLRNLYAKKEHKGTAQKSELFNKVLQWSFIFERYTKIARKETADRHAAQLTSPEKAANTVPWNQWQDAAFAFLSKYFVITGKDVVKIRTKADGYKPYFALPGGLEHKMRTRKNKLDDGSSHNYEPDLLSWWRADYNKKRADAGTDSRPNLRELRDCAILAVYSFLAPIRLDWATVEIMDEKTWASHLVKKEEADKVVAEQVKDLQADVVKVKRGMRRMNLRVGHCRSYRSYAAAEVL